MEKCTRETNDSANQTAEMEVDLTYDEEGFHCHTNMSFELEPTRTKEKEDWEGDVPEYLWQKLKQWE